MNKTAFITGGSQGIGRGIARVLSDAGYDVAFTYNRNETEAETLHCEITEKGRRSFYYQASFHLPHVAEEVTAKAVADLGGIDLLVCNAGVFRYNDIINLEGEYMDFMYNLSYRSYMLCSKVAAGDMVARGAKGNIVFISSTRSFRAYPDDAVYGSMKAALNRAVESMALDLAPRGIRVNCIAPGATAVRGNFTLDELTGGYADGIPLKRKGTPDEVGALVRYVASDDAAYMTGNTIKLDGGLILPGMPEPEGDADLYGVPKG